MPKSPFAWEDCVFLFNELNIYPPEGGTQFIELMKYCNVRPPRSLPILMHKFKILFIDYGGNLIGTCVLTGTAKQTVNEFLFYTIGGNNIVSRDMSISDCQFATDNGQLHFPVADGGPVGIALVHNNDPKELSKLDLQKDKQGRFTNKLLTPDDHIWVMANIQDLYVYTSSSAYVGCAVFQLYYSGYEPSKGRILRDWKDKTDVIDMSLSRCGNADPASSKLISSPFQPELFFMAPKSPGLPNRCNEAVYFVIEDMIPLRKKPRVDVSPLTRTSCTVINDGPAVNLRGMITWDSAAYKSKQDQAIAKGRECRKIVAVDVPPEVGKLALENAQPYQIRGTSTQKATQTTTTGKDFYLNSEFFRHLELSCTTY